MTFPNYYQYIEVGKPKVVIPFTNTSTPEIPVYALYADKFGQYPQVELYFINGSGNRAKYSTDPEFVLDSYDMIESINWGVLEDPISGFILLQ